MTGQTRTLTLATVGPWQHGKTSLVRWWTGWDTDRLKEEKQRGMSLEVGYAAGRLGEREFTVVDLPGHEECARARLTGLTGVEGFLLVVAADGLAPAVVREQLQILALLGAPPGLVVVTKIDRLVPEERRQVRLQLERALRETPGERAAIVAVSSVTGEGRAAFDAALEHLFQQIPARPADGVFRLSIARASAGPGPAARAVGVVQAGQLHLGQDVVLLPHGQVGRVRQLHAQGRIQPGVQAGQWAAVEIGSWEARTIQPGDVLTVPGHFAPRRWLLGHLRVGASEGRPWRSGTAVTLLTGTLAVPAHLYPLDGMAVHAGREHLVQLHTAEPIVAAAGDRFLLRAVAPAALLGGGLLLGTSTRRLPRNSPSLLAELHEQAERLWEERGGGTDVLERAGPDERLRE